MTPREVVYRLIAEIVCRPEEGIRGSDQLLRDLRMDGDDYGMWLVPELERRFGIHPRRDEWHHTVTVSDVISLVEKHVRESPHGEAK